MPGERGQATVEWIGLFLLVALALAALTHLAHAADDRDLGATLARSVTGSASRVGAPNPRQAVAVPRRGVALPRRRGALPPRGLALPRISPRPHRAGARPPLRAGPRPPLRLPELPESLRRAGRGAGVVWKRAWFACLVYERTRYALAHPESRFPGYTLPFDDALRMVNNCVSPVDILRDWPLLDGGGS